MRQLSFWATRKKRRRGSSPRRSPNQAVIAFGEPYFWIPLAPLPTSKYPHPPGMAGPFILETIADNEAVLDRKRAFALFGWNRAFKPVETFQLQGGAMLVR